CTKLGLRARALRVAALRGAALDYGELLQGRVTLTEAAQGWAEAVFDAEEFADFLVYPQVAAAAPQLEGAQFRFCGSVEISSADETLTFQGSHAGDLFRGTLSCGDGTQPQVSLHGDIDEARRVALERALASFFRSLYVDLAGVCLSFERLRFGKDVAAVLLKAEIRRIPNPFRDRI
ncbi:unnamed protein product, partial [Effrenium voratum]